MKSTMKLDIGERDQIFYGLEHDNRFHSPPLGDHGHLSAVGDGARIER
jgi:hypothetical protein